MADEPKLSDSEIAAAAEGHRVQQKMDRRKAEEIQDQRDRLAENIPITHLEVANGLGRVARNKNSAIIELFLPEQRKGGVQGSAPASTPLAWDVSVEPDTGIPGNSIITIWPGTVNGLLSSNYATSPSVVTAATYFFSARVTTAGQSVTGVTTVSASSAPAAVAAVQNALPNTLDILFAVVVNGTVFQVRHGNITISPQEVFRLEKSPLVPGSMPFDSWWNWSIAP